MDLKVSLPLVIPLADDRFPLWVSRIIDGGFERWKQDVDNDPRGRLRSEQSLQSFLELLYLQLHLADLSYEIGNFRVT